MSQVTQVRKAAAEAGRTDGYLPIEEYAPVGDGRTMALIGSDGSIDWMCLPDLDAPSVFAALLGPAQGGSFSLAPAIPFEAEREYVPGTNVLQTEFRTADGVVRVTEGLTIDNSQNAPWRELVRSVEGVAGHVPMQWRLHPRFDYGRVGADPARIAEMLVYRHGGLQIGLRTWNAGSAEVSDGAAEGRFRLADGERALLVLLASDDVSLPSPGRDAVQRRLLSTTQLWRDWVARATYDGPWQQAVQRSLLAIRLLADGRSGAITAAGTTSLPEVLAGERNYDYRFGWVRDLSFTVDALLNAGMDELAHASVGWLLGAVQNTHPRVDPVYGLTGHAVRSQSKLDLPGYRGTGPVHVGNQAGSQLQLGGFGDLIETIWRYAERGHVLGSQVGERLADSTDLLCAIWQQKDAGLWELDDRCHYTTSKIGSHTALDRLLELVERGQAPARHVERWRSTREQLRDFIERRLWSEECGSYVMKEGSQALDCGVLLASRRRYADPRGQRMNGTIDALREELDAGGALLYRYSGMQDEENAFVACSFWMIEALALAGRADEAAEKMEQMVSLAGRLGLYSEEIEPGTHSMRGNYPQALSHLALINAAVALDQAS